MSKPWKVPLSAAALAVAALGFSAPSAFAFTTENLNVSQSANSRFADPDSQVKNSQPFGPNGPMVHFGTSNSSSPSSPFRNHFGGSGAPPPSPYAMPPGNGN